MLEVRNLSKHFGGIRAVDACSFTVERGSITALIGPNGAGKTTAFNCISKSMAPTAGEVWLDGARIDQLRPYQVTRRGLSRTFQISRNLEEMTVLENLVVQSRVRHWRELLGPALPPAEQDKAMAIKSLGDIAVMGDDSAMTFLRNDVDAVLAGESATGVEWTREILGLYLRN